jgi:hypothetical protein
MRKKGLQISAISRFFSSSVFREMGSRGKSALFARLLKESFPTGSLTSLPLVSDVFEAAFSILRTEGCRDEYIYKAALTHKVLLGTHSLNTACMMSEFRVGDCKADLAILNGTAAVYEIKSERDSLSRLERQIEAYKKVFARIYVIAGENHVEAILATTSTEIGVMRLSERYRISTLREATHRPDRICATTVFDSIRTNEARQILTDLGILVPDVPNTILRSELRKRFSQLVPEALHLEMVRTLNQTRNLRPLTQLIDHLPPSLHAAALSIPLKKDNHKRLIGAVNTRLDDAMGWV